MRIFESIRMLTHGGSGFGECGTAGYYSLMLPRLAMFGVSGLLLAQAPGDRPRFEVASIKLHPGVGNLVHIQPEPGGRLAVENFSLRLLMTTAYDLQTFQVVGGPDWINSNRFDIQAKAEGDASGETMAGPMLQTLLEDRFALKFHRETRQLPVYELTVARGGAKLPRSKAGAYIPVSFDSPPFPAPEAGKPLPKYCGFRGFGVEGVDRKLEMDGVTAADLARVLARSELRRNVTDKTGLTGTFDVRMMWVLDIVGSAESTGPSIFTAIQEQLGLRLDAAKGPVEVLVIDHVEKPSAN